MRKKEPQERTGGKIQKAQRKKKIQQALIGITEEETQHSETEEIFQSTIQENYSEIKEDLMYTLRGLTLCQEKFMQLHRQNNQQQGTRFKRTKI